MHYHHMHTVFLEQKKKKDIKIVYIFVGFTILLVIIALLLIVGSSRVANTLTNMQESTDAYIVEENSISQMREVSDYLTEQCQAFIATGITGRYQGSRGRHQGDGPRTRPSVLCHRERVPGESVLS